MNSSVTTVSDIIRAPSVCRSTSVAGVGTWIILHWEDAYMGISQVGLITNISLSI